MNTRELTHWRGVIEQHQRIIEQLERLQYNDAAIWAGISSPPLGVYEQSDKLRDDIEQHRRAIADAQATLNAFCEPLFHLVGEFLHDAIKQQYPISGKTALVEVERELVRGGAYRHFVPRQYQIQPDESPSPIGEHPQALTIQGGLFAESRDSRLWWVGYDASIDTVFVA